MTAHQTTVFPAELDKLTPSILRHLAALHARFWDSRRSACGVNLQFKQLTALQMSTTAGGPTATRRRGRPAPEPR
jgi:hypothetical protein